LAEGEEGLFIWGSNGW